jgi:hypothetical protein
MQWWASAGARSIRSLPILVNHAGRVVHTWTCGSAPVWALPASRLAPPIYSRYYHIELTWMLFYTLVIAGTQVVARFCAVGLVDWFGRVAPP